MKYLKPLLLIYMLSLVISATCQQKYEQKDKEILEQVFNQLKNKTDKSTAELVVLVGKFFMETPYLASSLEFEPENLVINLRELDCTTYAENCLAIANSLKGSNPTFEQFTNELRNIRYRNGIIEGYLSRLHYFSDWIYENDKKGLVKQVSKGIANTPYPLDVNFMSSHPDSYKQLKSTPALVPIMAKKEKQISNRKMFFIPKNKLPDFEEKLQEGDIVGITTSIKGLDIIHVGIVVKKNACTHLMHASSKAEKVIISDNTLYEYLLGRKSATGIMVVRPL